MGRTSFVVSSRCRGAQLFRFVFITVLTGLVLIAVSPQALWAQGALEDPQPGSHQSGIGLIRGWVCQATRIDIEIDGQIVQAAYGTTRADTQSVCGDSNNGFGLTINWNLLGDGTHRVRAFADGNQFADVTFSVTTLGSEFLTGRSGGCTVPDFPQTDSSVDVAWQESNQNFVIVKGTGGGGGTSGDGQRLLEDPQPGSRQSGIGLIRGWVCQANRIDIEIDGQTIQAAYGTTRGDTQNICGDSNNGFGLTINWNLLGDGTHRVRAFADGTQFADVTFTVATLGTEFLTGRSGGCTVSDFPQTGTNVNLRWEESLQNFVIACVSKSAADSLVCQGLDALSTGNLNAANAAFSQAVAADSNDARANLYFALTRITVKALNDPQLASLASRSGVVITGDSSNVCELRVSFPQTVPSGAPRTGEILDTLSSVLAPEVDAALGNLSHLSDSVNITFDPIALPICLRPETQSPTVEIDRGDTLGLVGLLQAAQAAFAISAAYNFDVDLQTAVDGIAQQILAASPSLLTLTSGGSLVTARGFTDQSLANLSSAITAILAETDDQANDLLVVTPQDRADAERIQQTLDLVRQSLSGQVVLPTDIGLPTPERLDLSLFFAASFSSLQPFLPAFAEQGNFDLGRFPDPTFGGTTPDLTQEDINFFFGEAGVCVGVTVYDQANFAGQSKTFTARRGATAEISDLSLVTGPCGGTFNDCISSLKVPAGCRVRVFRDADFDGQFESFTADEPDLSLVTGPCAGSFNDCISSLEVRSCDPADLQGC